jgi:hypothetical protein
MASVRRAFWFAAGAASGVYGVFKVKRTLEIFTPDGVRARVAAARRGAQVFADAVAAAAREREADLLAELRESAPAQNLLEVGRPRSIAPPRHAASTRQPNNKPHKRESVTDGHR